MKMPIRYTCKNCYALLKNRKFTMDEDTFKEGTNNIHYVNVKDPVFQIPYYEIKSGKLV